MALPLARELSIGTEAPILWPSDEKRGLPGKDPDIRKVRRQEKGTTEDEMAGQSLK